MDIRIANRFKVIKKIGNGSFGKIYEGQDTITSERVAIKLESMLIKFPQVLYEAKILRLLQGEEGVPVLYWAGQEGEFNIMVTELLGPSIDDLHKYCKSKFTLKTGLLLGKQMISRLEYFQNKQFIHRDVKPENFCMGSGSKQDIVYLIDYGLSKRYSDPKSGQHIPIKEGKSMTGTARYASINTHLGLEQSRRDDLEALTYVLIFLIKGTLPWVLENQEQQQEQMANFTKEQKYNIIVQLKQTMTPKEITANLPIEFEDLLKYARTLNFTDRPDYSFIRKMFDSILFRAQYPDFNYDWKMLHKQDKVMKQLHQEKLFLKTEVNEGRRRYDPSLFKKEAEKAQEEFKLPSINGGEIVLDRESEKISRHASFVYMKSENATIAPDNKTVIENIREAELDPIPDGLSQLSIAKSFGRNGKHRLQEEEEAEEEGEAEDALDTKLLDNQQMGFSQMDEEEEGEDEEEEDEEQPTRMSMLPDIKRPGSQGIKPIALIGQRQKDRLEELKKMEAEKKLVNELHAQLQELQQQMLVKKDPLAPVKMVEEEKKQAAFEAEDEGEEEEMEEEEEDEQPTLVENTVKPIPTPQKGPDDKQSVLASILQGSPKAVQDMINRKALEKQKPTSPVNLPKQKDVEEELLLMFRAELKLYKGRRPTMDQLKYIDEKIQKLVTANYIRDFKLKEGQPELLKLINDTYALESYIKGNKVALNDAINGVNSQVQAPQLNQKAEEEKQRKALEEEQKKKEEEKKRQEEELEDEEMEEEEEEEMEDEEPTLQDEKQMPQKQQAAGALPANNKPVLQQQTTNQKTPQPLITPVQTKNDKTPQAQVKK